MTEQIGIVGGGIVGVALARALAQGGFGEVTVLEKERRVASHQTGHNSGVVHAGLYYAPDRDVARERRRTCRDPDLRACLRPRDRLFRAAVGRCREDDRRLAVAEDLALSRGVPGSRERSERSSQRHDLSRSRPRFPFLGVHFTRGVYDNVLVGPNAVPALAREGYRWRTISAKDTLASLRWAGAPALAKQHWRMGVDEVVGSLVKQIYFNRARKFIPELKRSDLTSKTAAGVRAQAWGEDGALLDDFAVDGIGPVVLLRNAPSPAATSSIAIARYVIENYMLAGAAS